MLVRFAPELDVPMPVFPDEPMLPCVPSVPVSVELPEFPELLELPVVFVPVLPVVAPVPVCEPGMLFVLPDVVPCCMRGGCMEEPPVPPELGAVWANAPLAVKAILATNAAVIR